MHKHYEKLLGLIKGEDPDRVSDSELAVITQSIILNYKRSGLLVKSMEKSVPPSRKYAAFLNLASSFKLGSYSMGDDSELQGNLSKLLRILAIGMSSGNDVTNNLEQFHLFLVKNAENKNQIKSKTDGMRVISLLGVIFFFPIFSGIAAGITLASGNTAYQRPISDGIRILSATYISIVIFISNFFLNPIKSFMKSLKSSLPLVIVACIFQYAAFYFASYAV